MGKAKLKMELINKEKLRNITFKKRKEGLVRKLGEFTTLCDVEACMIIYGPKQENVPVEAEIWPQNRDEVKRIVDIYKSKKKDSGNKSFDLNDFFHLRKKKIENELTRLQKTNLEAKYPTPTKLIEEYHMNVAALRAFASFLSDKATLVRSKIEELKRSRSSSTKHEIVEYHHQPNVVEYHHQPNVGSGLMNSQFYPHHPPVNDVHVPIYYPTIDHQHQHQQVHHVNQMMVMMKDDHHFGGASSSNSSNFQLASSFTQQIFNEASNRRAPPTPLPFYYAMPLPLPLPAPPVPQLPFSGGWENQDAGREDIADQNHMKKHEG